MDRDPILGEPVDTTPALRPGPAVLQGRYGAVEKLNAVKHGPALWEAIEGYDALWDFLRYGPFADKKSFLDYLEFREAQDDPHAYAIVDQAGLAKGISCLMEIRLDMRALEVGFILYAPTLQRTRLGTEAQYLLMRYAFETLNIRRYEWKCNALNGRSREAALRYGFTFEGIFRQHEIVKGRSRDTAWYSVLDCEWPARKAAFESWLDSANFDGEGRQKTPLQEVSVG